MKKSELMKLLEPYPEDQEIAISQERSTEWFSPNIKVQEEKLYPYNRSRYSSGTIVYYIRLVGFHGNTPRINVITLS